MLNLADIKVLMDRLFLLTKIIKILKLYKDRYGLEIIIELNWIIAETNYFIVNVNANANKLKKKIIIILSYSLSYPFLYLILFLYFPH